MQTLWVALAVTAVFVVVFGGADAVARLHSFRVDLSTPIDRRMPFVPETTVIYSSLYAMFGIAPFVLRTIAEVRMLARILVYEIVIAAPFFLALPMPESVPRGELGAFAGAFRLADQINLDHNQFPSLHATFAFTVAVVLGRRVGLAGQLLFAGWSLAIAVSTLLTGQHVIVDIAGALALSAVALTRAQRQEALRT